MWTSTNTVGAACLPHPAALNEEPQLKLSSASGVGAGKGWVVNADLLSKPRKKLAAASAGPYILIGGGYTSVHESELFAFALRRVSPAALPERVGSAAHLFSV